MVRALANSDTANLQSNELCPIFIRVRLESSLSNFSSSANSSPDFEKTIGTSELDRIKSYKHVRESTAGRKLCRIDSAVRELYN